MMRAVRAGLREGREWHLQRGAQSNSLDKTRKNHKQLSQVMGVDTREHSFPAAMKVRGIRGPVATRMAPEEKAFRGH